MDTVENLSLLKLFRQCSHQMWNLDKYRGQGRLLILLRERGMLTQRELADITGKRSATLSEQLDNMEKAGYVTREKNGDDRRNVNVLLTPLGMRTAADAEAARAELADQLFTPLSGEEKHGLSDLLQKLAGEWKRLQPEKEE